MIKAIVQIATFALFLLFLHQHKKINEALQKSVSYNDLLLYTIPLGISVIDERGTILFKNARMEKLSPGTNDGHSCWELYKDNKQQCDDCPLKNRIEPGITKTREVSGVLGGRTFEITHTGMNYNGAMAVLEVFTDITESKRAEEAIRSSNRQLRQLTEHLENVREEERTLVAREIHDDLGQILTTIKMDVSLVSRHLLHLGIDPVNVIVENEIGSVAGTLESAIGQVRKISAALRSNALNDLGFIEAMELHAEEFERHTGIACLLSHSDHPNLDGRRAMMTFKIFQEALTNVARHSGASRVEVALKETMDGVVMTIRDNGVGITESQVAGPASFGLTGMRERAKLLEGELAITGDAGRGTTVTLSIPLEGESG